MNLYQGGMPSGEDRESLKMARSKEQQKKQRFEPEWATKNNGLSTQVDGEPTKRKWEPDESDTGEETMDEEGNSDDVDACDEDTALGIPKIKFQPTPLPSLHAKKKQKKYSAAEMKQGDAATSASPPLPALAKKSKGGLSKVPKGKVKEEEEDRYEDFSSRGRSMGTREGPEDKKGKGYIKEEQEADEDPQEKEKKKKSVGTTIPKKPAGTKTKRAAEQPAKRTRKDPSNSAEYGSSPSSSSVAAGKKVGESGGQKSTAMTKTEMEIAFDIATEKMEWVILASTLNEKSGGTKHTSSNLKRHWVSVLRKRVIDGYID